MKILVGISSHGKAKDYTHEKLLENMNECVKPHADVFSFGDREIPGIDHVHLSPISTIWQDDMTYQSRDEIRKWAINYKYDAFIWQGSDCFYASESDFVKFFESAIYSHYDAVGALTAGRNHPDYAVARRFTEGAAQKSIPENELLSGQIIPAGFPGADALLVKPKLYHLSWKNWDYNPWYNIREEVTELNALCVEEFWCMKVLQSGHRIGLDTQVRTWHVHETGLAARWPGESKDIKELVFS